MNLFKILLTCLLLSGLSLPSDGQQYGRIVYPTPVRDFRHGSNNDYPTPIRSFLHGSHAEILPMVPVPQPSPQQKPTPQPIQKSSLDWDRLTASQKLEVAKYWRWSADAKHHMAAVQVRAGNNGGSGTLVRNDGLIITAAHVISGYSQATAIWSTGHQSSGPVVARNEDTDVAAFRVSDPPRNAAVIPVTEKSIKIPAWFEYCGYGGPTNHLRHWWAELTEGDADDNHSRTNALSGDSGGAVLVHWAGGKIELAGVIEGSRYTQAYTGEDGRPWPLHYPLRSSKTQHVRDILAQCGPYGCQPQYRIRPSQYGQPQYSRPRGAPTAPEGDIDPIQRPTPSTPPTPSQPESPPACELTEEQLQELVDTLAEDVRFKGPKGEPGPAGVGIPGPPGKDGADGAPGPGPTDAQIRDAVAEYVQAHMAEIVAAIPPIYIDGGRPAEIRPGDHLPPIWLRRVDGATGREKSVEPIYLGEGWTFHEFPHDQQHAKQPQRSGGT